MISICFIVPYFGTFPDTFEYWLQCCKYNKSINWIIFTDDETGYEYPENVKVIYTTLTKLKVYVEDKVGFEISLERSYKLCDLKALYGYIFDEYLTGYDYWGYCDLDMLFGDLRKFFSDEILNQYHKISYLGHMSLLKNIDEINKCFMDCDYKFILQTPRNMIFDEIRFSPNINELLEKRNYKIMKLTDNADIGQEHFYFELHGLGKGKRCITVLSDPVIFRYVDGRLYQLFVRDNELCKKEIIYVHFQKRKIEVKGIKSEYLLIPNRIIDNYDVTKEEIITYAKEKKSYFVKHKYIRLKNAIKRRLIR